MPEPTITIRDAAEADIPVVQEIYAHYVLNGLATFEIEAPDMAEMKGRWRQTRSDNYPYLVAEVDDGIGGYAYAGAYRRRPAYQYMVEDSVYVSPDHLGKGLGGKLLHRLIADCARLGYRQMVAVISDLDNPQSIDLHQRLGFEQAGTLHAAGFKHGRWVDTVLMQRALGPGSSAPPG